MHQPRKAERSEQEQPVYGWDAIGAELGVKAAQARRYEAQEIDPLPVFNPKGDRLRVAAWPSDLRAWKIRQPGSSRRKERAPRERSAA